MKILASDLLNALQEHIAKHGDGDVLIFDGYQYCYKTITFENLSKTHGNKFVIECEEEEV